MSTSEALTRSQVDSIMQLPASDLFDEIVFNIHGPQIGMTQGSLKKLLKKHGGKVVEKVIGNAEVSHIILSGGLWGKQGTASADRLIKLVMEANEENRTESDDEVNRTWLLDLNWVYRSLLADELLDERKYDYDLKKKGAQNAKQAARKAQREKEMARNNGKSKFARGERIKFENEQKRKRDDAEQEKLEKMDLAQGAENFSGLNFLNKKDEGKEDVPSSDRPSSSTVASDKAETKSLKHFGFDYGGGAKTKQTKKGSKARSSQKKKPQSSGSDSDESDSSETRPAKKKPASKSKKSFRSSSAPRRPQSTSSRTKKQKNSPRNRASYTSSSSDSDDSDYESNFEDDFVSKKSKNKMQVDGEDSDDEDNDSSQSEPLIMKAKKSSTATTAQATSRRNGPFGDIVRPKFGQARDGAKPTVSTKAKITTKLVPKDPNAPRKNNVSSAVASFIGSNEKKNESSTSSNAPTTSKPSSKPASNGRVKEELESSKKTKGDGFDDDSDEAHLSLSSSAATPREAKGKRDEKGKGKAKMNEVESKKAYEGKKKKVITISSDDDSA